MFPTLNLTSENAFEIELKFRYLTKFISSSQRDLGLQFGDILSYWSENDLKYEILIEPRGMKIFTGIYSSYLSFRNFDGSRYYYESQNYIIWGGSFTGYFASGYSNEKYRRNIAF